MGQRKKKFIIFIILCMSTLLFTGCDLFSFDFIDDSENEKNVITVDPSEDQEVLTPVPENNQGKENADESVTPMVSPTPAVQPASTVNLSLYSVNMDTGVTEPFTTTITKDTEITPRLIVDKVVEAMADRSLEVGIENVTTEGKAIIISFYRNKAPLSEGGNLYEGPILDAIAMSLIGNLDDYNKIIYRAEGKAYISDHIELGINEAYMTE